MTVLISSKCYIDIKIVLQGCVTPSLCWDLDLLHVNDIHVRMEETNKYSAACRSSTFDLKTKWIFAIEYSILFSPISSVLLRLWALPYILFLENGGGWWRVNNLPSSVCHGHFLALLGISPMAWSPLIFLTHFVQPCNCQLSLYYHSLLQEVCNKEMFFCKHQAN